MIVEYLKSLQESKPVKIAAYVMFRMESGNGKSGINNNYCGFQADSGRWPAHFDNHITGTVTKNENKTGKERIFLAFASWKTSVDLLVDRVKSRGLYVGGYARLVAKTTATTPEEWATVYYRDWVTGNAKAVPESSYVAGLTSMYRQGEKIF